MTTKEYLSSVKRLDNMINEKLDEIYRLKTRATNITVSCDRERVQGTSDIYKSGEEIVDLVDMGKDVDLLTDILVDTKRNIKNICKKMDNEEQAKILILHYIEYKSFSQIATICGMKVGKAKYTCKIARKKFGEIFEIEMLAIPLALADG